MQCLKACKYTMSKFILPEDHPKYWQRNFLLYLGSFQCYRNGCNTGTCALPDILDDIDSKEEKD